MQKETGELLKVEFYNEILRYCKRSLGADSMEKVLSRVFIKEPIERQDLEPEDAPSLNEADHVFIINEERDNEDTINRIIELSIH